MVIFKKLLLSACISHAKIRVNRLCKKTYGSGHAFYFTWPRDSLLVSLDTKLNTGINQLYTKIHYMHLISDNSSVLCNLIQYLGTKEEIDI